MNFDYTKAAGKDFIIDTLRSARLLVNDETKWCADKYAVDDAGKGLHYDDSTAVRYSFDGAIKALISKRQNDPIFVSNYMTLIRAHLAKHGLPENMSFAQFNDVNGYQATAKLIDSTICGMTNDETNQ